MSLFDLLDLKKSDDDDDPLLLVLFLQTFRRSVKDTTVKKNFNENTANHLQQINKLLVGKIRVIKNIVCKVDASFVN